MANRPNILLIVADQLRADALGYYGNTICRTPNLDRLAARGAVFEQAYTVAPVCSPARCSMLTGLYPHAHKVMLNTHIDTRTQVGLDPALPTFSALLHERGEYDVHYLGKWHVHEDLSPSAFGFQSHQGFPNQIPPEHLTDRVEISFPNGTQLVNAVHTGAPEELGAYRMAQSCADFLRLRRGEARPFFMRVDFIQPHFANIVPARFRDMYAQTDIPEWANFRETFAGKPYGQVRKLREWALEGKGWDWWQQVVRMYYADVSYLDHCCGIMLDALHAQGLEQDTVVIFTADHADPTGMHRHFEKGGTMYDEVMHIPMLVCWPGVGVAGARHPQFVRNMDICPTILRAAGLDAPQGIHARDFTDILSGDDPGWYDALYAEYHGDVWGMYTQRMVRTRDWKYVYNPYDLDELYDLNADPFEMNNLAQAPEHAAHLINMQARFAGWVDATNDVFTYPFVRRMLPDPILP